MPVIKIKNQISKIKNTNQKLKINKDINAENIGQTGLWEDCRNKKIPYYLVSQKGTLKSSTEEYNKTVSKLFPRYDFRMAILGMGKDGHTAGLMSGHEKIWNINDYVIGYKLDQKQMFKQRITITPFMLSKLDYALAGMVGEEKKQALESTLNPDNFDELDKYLDYYIKYSCNVIIIISFHFMSQLPSVGNLRLLRWSYIKHFFS